MKELDMSIRDRLTKKTEGLLIQGKQENMPSQSPAPLRTGPGQMLMVNSLMKESNEKVAFLEGRLKDFEGALPVRFIDPAKIIASKWANRINHSFESAEFKNLKAEIDEAKGNVQPIKVRPLQGIPDRYEIVFGHRRHRACLELNLSVLALVEDVSDQDLFKEMDRENRARLDLSPWEQGKMYRRALNEKLFSSLGDISKELGVDKGNISKALRLADLPDDVVNAFPSPLDLQYRWAKLLHDAIQGDPDGVLMRAKALAENKSARIAAKDVLDTVIGIKSKPQPEQDIIVAGKAMAKVSISGDQVSIQFSKGVLNEEKTQILHDFIEQFLVA
jgi:ParB family transcriptional regulator, chromosome partitioning protein